MKSRYLIFLLVGVITVLSCNRNKLKTNEKELTLTIQTAEAQLAYEAQQRKEREKELADMLAKRPRWLQFNEERDVVETNIPKLIKIAKERTDSVNLSLSDVVRSVEYIRLESIPDSTNLRNGEISAKLTSKHIIVYGVSGIYLYNRSGKYIKTIIQNDIENLKVDNKYGGIRTSWHNSNLIYRGHIGDVWVLGDNLYYTAVDFAKNEYSFRQYNLENDALTVSLANSKEELPSEFPGKEIARLTTEQAEGFQKQFSAVTTNIPLGKNIFITIPSVWSMVSRGTNIAIYGLGNDTICRFSNDNQVQNYSKTIISRGDSRNRRYFFKGELLIYPMFSDTIFQVVPPNKLIPIYVFDFGEYKPSPNEYFSPGNLNGKMYISNEIAEAPGKLFFEYRDIDGSNKFGIYQKQTGKFVHVSNCQRGLPDDIDGILAYWPKILNNQNEECKIHFASSLKHRIKNPPLDHLKAPREQETRDFITRLNEDDHVVIIYKLK